MKAPSRAARLTRLGLFLLAVGILALACGRSGLDPGDAESGTFRLTVVKVGNGAPHAAVVSAPPGIDCGSTCTSRFPIGTSVTLTTGPEATFLGWEGDCSGAGEGPCTVVLDAHRSATAHLATSGSVVWARNFGGAASDFGEEIAILPSSGDVVIAGRFENDGADFGTGCTLDTVDVRDVFVARYDARTGACVWARSFGSSQEERVNGLDVSPADEIGLRGWFFGDTLTVGSSITLDNSGSGDAWSALLDRRGTVLWARNSTNASRDEGTAACIDEERGLVGAAIVDLGNGDAQAGVARISLDDPADVTWTSPVAQSGPMRHVIEDVACDRDGSIFMAGSQDGGAGSTLTYDGPTNDVTVTSAGGGDLHLVRFGLDGNPLASFAVGNATFERTRAVAARPGLVALGGEFTQDLSAGTVPLDHAPSADLDAFVLFLSPDLATPRTAYVFTGTGDQEIRDITFVGSGGDAAVVGHHDAPFQIGGDSIPFAGGSDDFYVARVTTAGSPVWARHFGGTGDDEGSAIAWDRGRLFVVAEAESMPLRDYLGRDVSLTTHGAIDAVLLRLVP